MLFWFDEFFKKSLVWVFWFHEFFLFWITHPNYLGRWMRYLKEIHSLCCGGCCWCCCWTSDEKDVEEESTRISLEAAGLTQQIWTNCPSSDFKLWSGSLELEVKTWACGNSEASLWVKVEIFSHSWPRYINSLFCKRKKRKLV